MDIDEVNNRCLTDKAKELFAVAISQKVTEADMILFWDLVVVIAPMQGVGPVPVAMFIMGMRNPLLGQNAIVDPTIMGPIEACCQLASVEQVVDHSLATLHAKFRELNAMPRG